MKQGLRVADYGSESREAIRNPRPAKRLLIPALICLAQLIALFYVSRSHPFGTYATETDFYQYYAPDAERVAAARFPENPYLGPGYPLALALAANLTGDIFAAGKLISITSAAIVGLLTFALFERLFDYRVGLGAQLVVAVTNYFPQFSIAATTDAFFLMICLAAIIAFTCERAAPRWRVAAAAALAGVAYLVRYNAWFLVATFLLGLLALNMFGQGFAGRVKLSALFISVFLITASPWLYANYRHNGSPFYNENYLNVATEFYPELANENVYQEGTRALGSVFDSFGDVLGYSPRRILSHYPVNLYESLKKSVTGGLVSPVVGWLALAGIALALALRRSKQVLLVLAAAALCFLLLALTHWEARYYFFIAVVYAGFAVHAVFQAFDLARSRGLARSSAFVMIPVAIVGAMWWDSFSRSKKDLKQFLASHPAEVLAASDYIKSTGARGARVMARKPHLAYLSGQSWVFTPQVKSLDELRQWVEGNPVDFIAIGSVEISRRPALAPLRDPKAAPPWLKPVWVNDNPPFVIYQPSL